MLMGWDVPRPKDLKPRSGREWIRANTTITPPFDSLQHQSLWVVIITISILAHPLFFLVDSDADTLSMDTLFT